MICCDANLVSYRNSDLRVTYTFPSGYDLTGFSPTFYFRPEPGAATLLTLTPFPVGAGSKVEVVGSTVVLTLKKLDLSVFPDQEVWDGYYDSILTKDGFMNRFVGGPMVQYVDGSFGDSGQADSVRVDFAGKQIPIMIQGGNLGVASSLMLSELNSAVASAETSATDAESAATTAIAATVNKIDLNGANGTVAVRSSVRPLSGLPGSEYDASYDILQARILGETDDANALNVALSLYRDVVLTPIITGLFVKTSVVSYVPNTHLRFTGGFQAIPVFRHPTHVTSTFVWGNPSVQAQGCAGGGIENAWLVHPDRLGWYNGHAEGTPLPNRLTGGQSHVEIHGAQGGTFSIGGYGCVHMASIFGGNNATVIVKSYGGFWDPLYTACQEAISVIRTTYSAVHGHGTEHELHLQLVGGNITTRRSTVVGAKTVDVTRRVGPLYGVLIESAENIDVPGGFSGGMAGHNFAILPIANSFIANIKIRGHNLDESNLGAFLMLRSSPAVSVPNTVIVSDCTFNGQLVGLRAIDASGDSGLFAVINLRLRNNTYRAHLFGCNRLTGVDGGISTGERYAGYNCARNDTADGGDATSAAIFIANITRNFRIDGAIFGGGINNDYETDVPDAYGISPNATQWGIIDTTGGTQGNVYYKCRSINFGKVAGGLQLGSTIDSAA